MHILVMTEFWQSALACIQSFGRKGHIVSVIGEKTGQSANVVSKFVKNVVSLPDDSDAAIQSAGLVELVASHKVDLVVPVSDKDALLVAMAKDSSPANSAFVTSSLKSIELARSRNSTTALCNRLGIATPPTVCIDSATDVAAAANGLGYPFFLKQSGTVASQGVSLVNSPSELQTLLEKLPDKAEYQLQKPVTGDFIGATGFAIDGTLFGPFAFKTEYRHSRGGNPPYAILVQDPRLDAMLAKIASALNWTGGIDIDCLQTETGDYVLLEINPRLSGTTVFPLKLGLDLPAYYLWTLIGKTPDTRSAPQNYAANGFISRVNEVQYVSANPQERLAEASEFRRKHTCVDSIFWDDVPYTQTVVAQMLQIAWAAPHD